MLPLYKGATCRSRRKRCRAAALDGVLSFHLHLRAFGVCYKSMSGKNFHEVIQLIRKEDARYETGAYVFMRQALDHTLKGVLEKEQTEKHRHITGQEPCEGIREFALEQYGPMARTLLNEWGIRQTEDFGQIVFNLVEYGIFGKTEQDSVEDFNKVYDFEQAFDAPFRPTKQFFPHPVPTLTEPS